MSRPAGSRGNKKSATVPSEIAIFMLEQASIEVAMKIVDFAIKPYDKLPHMRKVVDVPSVLTTFTGWTQLSGELVVGLVSRF